MTAYSFGDLTRFAKRHMGAMLAPLLTLITGCQLWESPIYPRPGPAREGEARLRVLFVGNSLTYYNDLPGLVQQFSLGEGKPMEIATVTRALASLQWHWSNGTARERIGAERWDFVVIQDYSTMPAEYAATSVEYFGRFSAEIRKRGATPIVFENWLRQSNAGSAERMSETYRVIEEKTGAPVARIGTAWRRCGVMYPEIRLLKDDRHPRVAGTYLAACVLYKTIYGKTARGLPRVIAGLRLKEEVAGRLQEVADAVDVPQRLSR